jgi:hypothetical protein
MMGDLDIIQCLINEWDIDLSVFDLFTGWGWAALSRFGHLYYYSPSPDPWIIP